MDSEIEGPRGEIIIRKSVSALGLSSSGRVTLDMSVPLHEPELIQRKGKLGIGHWKLFLILNNKKCFFAHTITRSLMSTASCSQESLTWTKDPAIYGGSSGIRRAHGLSQRRLFYMSPTSLGKDIASPAFGFYLSLSSWLFGNRRGPMGGWAPLLSQPCQVALAPSINGTLSLWEVGHSVIVPTGGRDERPNATPDVKSLLRWVVTSKGRMNRNQVLQTESWRKSFFLKQSWTVLPTTP